MKYVALILLTISQMCFAETLTDSNGCVFERSSDLNGDRENIRIQCGAQTIISSPMSVFSRKTGGSFESAVYFAVYFARLYRLETHIEYSGDFENPISGTVLLERSQGPSVEQMEVLYSAANLRATEKVGDDR
jgi:hypothetical protein